MSLINKANEVMANLKRGTGKIQQQLLNRNADIYQKFPDLSALPATSATPAEPVSKPTFAMAEDNFGTMRHVEPIRDHFIYARNNIETLREIITNTLTGKSLLTRVEEFLDKHNKDYDYKSTLNELGISILSQNDESLKGITDPNRIIRDRFFRKTLPNIGADLVTTSGNKIPHNAHSALFATGTVMTDDIRTMEALRHALVKLRRKHQQDLEKKQAELEDLNERIAEECTTLKGLEEKRSETLDDYAVAQRLLAEHWQEVEQAYAERKQIIESNVGLYYVRVRETPLSRTLPDPLDLRPGDASDLVPGCHSLPTPLAEELLPFMETVLDIPASDWTALSKLSSHLPGRIHLEQMVLKRRQRIQIKLKTPAIPTVSHPTLTTLLFNHQAMVQSIAAKPFAVAALRDMQQEGHKILALEDLLASPIPALRDPASQLHQRLNAAAGCLLSRLRTIKPSIRLAWADLADDNRLVVESPERWPHLENAEGDDFNNIRTLIELLGWWFRQLDGDASGDSRTAMRNFVRACLLLSASDDPQQLLQGQLKSLPTRFRPGELLRLDLNREPAPGNLLQLMDDKQQVIATVRVEDHDNNGTLASIATVINPNIPPTSAMRVTGQRK
ncbi:MAG: hypothetical protein HYS20_00430 [Rhodocyclales bacterium]|nr:hypothetical protein [Rhodocyclales bacterium]